jgi:L-seryl-tRNA(Ser) seleniumtransferase
MIAATPEGLGRRAEALVAALPASARARVAVTEMQSTVGGGSLPGEQLESVGLVVTGAGAATLAARLRAGDPAVVGRIQDGAVLLDLRTILPADDEALARALGRAVGGKPGTA